MTLPNQLKALVFALGMASAPLTVPPGSARAESRNETNLDPAPPVRAGSFSFNLAGILFSRYSTEIEVTLTSSVIAFGEVSYVRTNGDALDFHLGVRWYPVGQGIDGIFLGMALGAADVLLLAVPIPSARASVGYAFAIDAFMFALEAGARAVVTPEPVTVGVTQRLSPDVYVRVAAGYTWW